MWSPLKVFGVVFVTPHTFPISVRLHLFSPCLDFLNKDTALRHERVIHHKKASAASSGLFVMKGAFKFNHVERKSGAALCPVDCNFPACGFFWASQSVCSQQEVCLWTAVEKAPVQITMRCLTLWRDNHPSIHLQCPLSPARVVEGICWSRSQLS